MEQFLLTLQPHGHLLISWSLLQTLLSSNFFCADPIGSALDPFTFLQRSACQNVNKWWLGRRTDTLILLSSRVCQSRLLTTPEVTLSPLVTQMLFSAHGNREGHFSSNFFQFISKCLHHPRCCCFLLQKLHE